KSLEQRVVAGGVGDDGEAGGDGVDEALGGGDGLFFAGGEIDRDGGGGGERGAGRVGQRNHNGAAVPRRLRHGDDVGALAGLRDGDGGTALEGDAAAIDRGDRRADRGDRDAGGELDRVL